MKCFIRGVAYVGHLRGVFMAKKKFNLHSKAVSSKIAVAKKKIVEAEKKIKKFVKENPKTSILIAAALAAAVTAATIIAVKKLRKK